MRRAAAVWVTCLALITIGGCVPESKHQAVVAELETARQDLESARTQQKALEQQIHVLAQLNAQTEREVRVASAELQRAKIGDEAERNSLDAQLATLEKQMNHLVGQQKALRRAIQDAKDDTVTLKSLAELYQKKLRESSEPMAAASPPPVILPPERAVPAPAPFPSPAPSPPAQAEPTPAVEQPGQQASPPPMAQQPPATQDSRAADHSWLSVIKRWAISMWQMVFS